MISFLDRCYRLGADGLVYTLRILTNCLRKDTPVVEMPTEARTVATTQLEWNFDMDKQSVSLGDFRPGDYGRAELKGRCKSCWGGLIGRTNDRREVTGIKCRVCGKKLEGEDAMKEYKRISGKSLLNLMNMGLGHAPKYGDGVFVEKTFPHLHSLTQNEIEQRISIKAAEENRKSTLTRSGFPLGSPGYLFMQAKVLMSGVEDISDLRERSIADFDEFDMKADGSAVIYLSMDGLSDDPRYHEYRLMRKMGTTMMEAMISAFACELAMKAICLTRKDEAEKSHDLLNLYRNLPGNSRKRLEADFPEIQTVMEKGRQTFGGWRYFETSVGERGMRSMIDTQQAQALGKTARVLLDEAELIGLGYSVSMNAKQSVQMSGQKTRYNHKFNLSVEGRESPPKNDGD